MVEIWIIFLFELAKQLTKSLSICKFKRRQLPPLASCWLRLWLLSSDHARSHAQLHTTSWTLKYLSPLPQYSIKVTYCSSAATNYLSTQGRGKVWLTTSARDSNPGPLDHCATNSSLGQAARLLVIFSNSSLQIQWDPTKRSGVGNDNTSRCAERLVGALQRSNHPDRTQSGLQSSHFESNKTI